MDAGGVETARSPDRDDCRRGGRRHGGKDGAAEALRAGGGGGGGSRTGQRGRAEAEAEAEAGCWKGKGQRSSHRWQRASDQGGSVWQHNGQSATAICAARMMSFALLARLDGALQALSRDVISHALKVAQISLIPSARSVRPERGRYTQIQFVRPIQSLAPQPGPLHSRRSQLSPHHFV